MSDDEKQRKLNLKINKIEETQMLARAFSTTLKTSGILCLQGDLGAGKTTFTQFLCRELGVDDYVTSPTFNIVNSYEGILPVHHFDVYRISDPDEMYEIGFDDYLYGGGICIIEWANLIEDLIPPNSFWMTIRLTEENLRVVEISGEKSAVEALEKQLDLERIV